MRTWGIVIVVVGILVLYLGISGKAYAAWLALSGWAPPEDAAPKPEAEAEKVPDDADMRGGIRA